MPRYRRCEVCGRDDPRPFLRSSRLDGPLVRCRGCGLLYVGVRDRDFTFAAADPELTRTLGGLVDRLGLVDRELEDAWVAAAAGTRESERLRAVTRRAAGGRLLDVGAGSGSFVAAAGARFQATGLEPDPGTSARAREAGLDVRTATLDSLLPAREWDVVTMFHVLEHLDSPRAAIAKVRALIRPGGLLMIETPTVENPWFALAPARWRQLIPDHYWFFSPATLGSLLAQCGFEVVELRHVGTRVSLEFAVDRLRRAGVPGASAARAVLDRSGLAGRRARLNPRDILQVLAIPIP